MRHDELLRDLLGKERERRERIWREAEAEAARLETAAREEIAAAGREHAGRQRSACEEMRVTVCMEARKKADQITTLAKQRLADRLQRLAREVLLEIGGERHGELLERIAGELPRGDWALIRVGPQDAEQAAQLFPDAEIRPDEAVSGGLVATAAEGGFTVVNTLEKRLERGWPVLAAELLAVLAGEEQDGPAA